MENGSFFKIQKQLARAVKIRRKSDGKELKLTCQNKQLYAWCFDKYVFWERNGKVFHNNQDEIAFENGVSEISVVRFIKEFTKFGIIKKNSTKVRSHIFSNNYKVVNIFKSADYELIDLKENVSKVDTVKTKPLHHDEIPKQPKNKPEVNTSNYDDDDLDLPF